MSELTMITEAEIRTAGTDWHAMLRLIEQVTHDIASKEVVQPLKPYLRFGEHNQRIIAMPAYVGGEVQRAGLKWIASFPANIERGMARAHSLTILNDVESGVPLVVLDSARLSAIRTVAVSAYLMKLCEAWLRTGWRVGIIGFGPIGHMHFDMLNDLYGAQIAECLLYDVRQIAAETSAHSIPLRVCQNWQELYEEADVIITCTVAKERYIDRSPPKQGKLLLHVSLRDYMPQVLQQIPLIVVDRWNEVCREQTDIEQWHNLYSGARARTVELADAVHGDFFRKHSIQRPTLLFSPMGMAVYDIAVADYYYRMLADKKAAGDLLG